MSAVFSNSLFKDSSGTQDKAHPVGSCRTPGAVLTSPQPRRATEQEQQEAARGFLCAVSGFKQLSQREQRVLRDIFLFAFFRDNKEWDAEAFSSSNESLSVCT